MDLICASANPNKYEEMSQILSGVVNLIPRPMDIPEVVEDADDLLGNARLKAAAIQSATGYPAVADDTGLEVDALEGAPGVFSARYAGPNATYEDNVQKLLNEMKGVPLEKRSARFRTIALISLLLLATTLNTYTLKILGQDWGSTIEYPTRASLRQLE